MSFTLFVKLPSEDVCSLRRLPTRSSIRAVRKMLEVHAGLPAQTYDLACPDGKLFWPDDALLQLDKNVWEGYVMRAVFRDSSWQELYDAVVANDVDRVLEYCLAVNEEEEKGDDGKAKEMRKKRLGRGVVALFVASFLGLADLCRALVCAGVDPDGKTPFGKTPLFAAMSGDHVHVTELLLSHHAALDARDVDGTSALDLARERQAKDCLRKVRHMKLFSRASSASSSSVASRTSARGSDLSGGGGKTTQHRGVIRIPTGTDAEAEASFFSPRRSPNHDTLPAVRSSCEDGDSSVSPARSDASPTAEEASVTNGASSSSSSSKLPTATPTAGSRPSPRTLFQHGEVYAWDNNLRSVSRASSAAGTQVRIPVPGRDRVSSARSSNGRASIGHHGVSWNDTVSVMSSGSGNRRPSIVRLSVQDLSITGPDAVLKVSCPLSPPQTNHTTTASGETSLTKHRSDQELTSSSPVPDTRETDEPHSPAQEPPERPPSRVENPQMGGGEGEEGSQAVAESVRITVPGPEQGRDRGSRSSPRAGPRHARQSRRGKQQASWRTTMKRRLKLAEDQKRNASPPKSKPNKQNRQKDAANRANFQQWLQRKRQEKERQQDSSEDESSSSSDDYGDDKARSAENERAFNDWLRDLKERPLRGPHPFTVASLHRRKSRPLKNLIQVGGGIEETVPPPEPDTYMTAYKEWRRSKSSTDSEGQLSSPRDLKEAKKRMEEKRRSLLAMALTYEDWLELNDQQHKLMQAMLRADTNNSNNKKQGHSPADEQLRGRAPRQISFHDWRQRLEKREAELRHAEKLHDMRSSSSSNSGSRGAGGGWGEPLFDRNGFLIDDGIRSSAAIPHDEWLRRKKKKKEEEEEEVQRSRNKNPTVGCRKTGSTTATGGFAEAKLKPGMSPKTDRPTTRTPGFGTKENRRPVAVVSSKEEDDGKESAWEMWLQRKHQSEMERLAGPSTYQGKQLLLSVHEQKKAPRVTQC